LGFPFRLRLTEEGMREVEGGAGLEGGRAGLEGGRAGVGGGVGVGGVAFWANGGIAYLVELLRYWV
jgi:hypothetical protein